MSLFLYSLKEKGEINTNFRQKYIAHFDATQDPPFLEMISCCCNSPNLPTCYLWDCILAKYHPGSRITILLIHPANFTVSPFDFVRYNSFKKPTTT